MFELTQLEQLVTIAQEGTISKAAETLLISQPALTRSIQRLEEDLGLSLFDRKKNKITLNDNGSLAVELAQQVLQNANQMVKTLRAFEQSKESIGIGSCAPAPLWELVTVLHQVCPQLNINESLQSNEDVLLDELMHHEHALVILNHPLETEMFTCIKLFEECLYLSLPPAHPLALFKEISFQDLDGESVLLLSQIGFWNEICLRMIPKSHLLIQEDNAVFQELTKMSALPYFKSNITMLDDKEDHHRVTIPIKDEEAHTTYYVIYHKQNNRIQHLLKQAIYDIDWTAYFAKKKR